MQLRSCDVVLLRSAQIKSLHACARCKHLFDCAFGGSCARALVRRSCVCVCVRLCACTLRLCLCAQCALTRSVCTATCALSLRLRAQTKTTQTHDFFFLRHFCPTTRCLDRSKGKILPSMLPKLFSFSKFHSTRPQRGKLRLVGIVVGCSLRLRQALFV